MYRTIEEMREFVKAVALPINWEKADALTDEQFQRLRKGTAKELEKLTGEYQAMYDEILIHGEHELDELVMVNFGVMVMEQMAIVDQIDRILEIRSLTK